MRFFWYSTLLFSLIFFHQSAWTQAPAVEWQKVYGGNIGDIGDRATCVQQTTDGGYVVAGYAHSADGDVTSNHGKSDFWILKLDSAGNIQWKKAYGGSSDEYAYAIRQTSDGGYVVAGYAASDDGDVSGVHGPVNTDYWVMKISSTGVLQWQKCFGGSDTDVAKSIDLSPDGGYVVAGYTRSNDGNVTGQQGFDACWVIKLDRNGNLQWQKIYGNFPHSAAESIRATKDGGYVVAAGMEYFSGNLPGYHGSIDYWIIKINSTGIIEWQSFYGGSSSDYPHSIEQAPDGGYIVAGTSNSYDGQVTGNHSSNISGATDGWIVKLNSSGSLEWQKCLGGSYVEEAFSVKPLPGGGYIVAAGATSTDGDITVPFYSKDFWIVNLTNDGNIEWQKSYGGSDYDEPNWIECTKDGGFIVAGSTNSGANDGDVTNPHYGNNYWIVKLKPVPCTPSIAISASATTICMGAAVTFTATVFNEGPDPVYQWMVNGAKAGTDSSFFSSSSLAQGDVVTCLLISNAACSLANDSASSNSIAMNVINIPQPSISVIASDSSICPGVRVNFTAVPQNANANPSYQWQLNGTNTVSSGLTYSNASLSDGDQVRCILSVPNSDCGNGSDTSRPITIQVYPLPNVSLSPVDTLVESGTQVQINASVTGTLDLFSWEPAGVMDDPSSLTPLTQPLVSSVTYALSVLSAEGCSAKASGEIKVKGAFYMPSAFSPNGDGLNDVFRIPRSASLLLKQFSIYNRWGEEIFRTTDPGKGWNGTFKGRPLESSAFVYLIRGTMDGKEKVFKGTVVLIR